MSSEVNVKKCFEKSIAASVAKNCALKIVPVAGGAITPRMHEAVQAGSHRDVPSNVTLNLEQVRRDVFTH